MPFDSAIAPFVGDDDMGDFLLDVWEPFASMTMGWVSNRFPGSLALPNAEVWTHRGTTGSPEPPFVFMRTSGSHIWHFPATGIDTGQDIQSQPGQPSLSPSGSGFDDTVTDIEGSMRCPFSNSLVGPYEGYWLFGDTAGTYIHCVLKVAARQYRHWHVGLLNPLHSALNADSFYTTMHFWQRLDPDGLGFQSYNSGGEQEHAPYQGQHHPPFITNTGGGTTAFSWKYQLCPWYYMPGLRGDLDTDFYHPDGGIGTSDLGSQIVGRCDVAGYGGMFGRTLWNCDKTFTSGLIPLIPIYIAAGLPFGGVERMAPVAQIPDVFRVNMRDLTPEQEIVIGSDTYVVFPVINSDSANTLDGEGYSGWEGLAYRKETGAVS